MSSREAVVVPLTRGATPEVLDRELIERSLQGDRVAPQLLYRRHVHAVTERVTRLLSRSAEAEDVVQDVFVAAFDDLSQLADRSRFGAWLMGIAVHQVHRRFRRRRLLARLGLDRGSDDARLEQIADPALSPEARAQLGRIDQALTGLPLDLRLAWMLRHVEGCELLEAAAQCRCSLATIKRRLARAEASVRAALAAGGTP